MNDKHVKEMRKLREIIEKQAQNKKDLEIAKLVEESKEQIKKLKKTEAENADMKTQIQMMFEQERRQREKEMKYLMRTFEQQNIDVISRLAAKPDGYLADLQKEKQQARDQAHMAKEEKKGIDYIAEAQK